MKKHLVVFTIFSGCLLLFMMAAFSHTSLRAEGGTNNLFLPAIMSSTAAAEPSNNLQVTAATYLGGSGADKATAVDIALNGSLVLGGKMPGHNPGSLAAIELAGGGDGVIVRLSSTAQTVLSVTRYGDVVNDLAVANSSGQIVVCGDKGVAVLSAEADSLSWQDDTIAEGKRCAIGDDDVTAVIAGGEVFVFDEVGNLLGQWDSGSNPADVTVDAANHSVIVTGWKQASGNLQVPWLKAWSYDGSTQKWEAYNFSASAVNGQGLGADSRGLLVAMGRDGTLYFAGRTDGGNNVFNRNPQDITATLPGDVVIKTDRYNNPYQLSGSTNFGFYGRFNPATGQILKGQFMLTRLSSGNGNAIQAHGLMADENGRLYISGQAYATLEDRALRQIAGVTVGPYSGGEPFLLIVAPDFSERLIWTPFAGSNGAGGSPAYGVSVRNGRAAVVIGLRAGNDNLITFNALQNSKGGDAEAYLAVWPQSGE